MFVGKERLFYCLLSQSLIAGRLLSPRPRPQGRAERSAFKADFSTSAHLQWAFGRNDIRFRMQFLSTILTCTPFDKSYNNFLDISRSIT